MTSTTDRARLIGFVATSGLRRLLARFGGVFAGGLPFDGRAPTRLLIAPHDLRTADPTIAGDIYRGRFSLSGTAADIGGTSPFLLTPPSRAWQEELLSFSWLRHLHAADDPVSRVHARALIADWIALQRQLGPVGRLPHVVARRLIAWLAHSPLYLTNAEPEFYRAVMRSFGRQLRYLARHVHLAPDGVPRLTAHIATVYATLCISGLERLQARAMRQLARELDRQVLPDGGHISRDPGAILELLLDLLPLRQTFLSRDVAPPQAMIGAIDRMMPMVRFFRHSDGAFGLFNGMGRTAIGDISTVLAYDDSRGRPSDQAPHSGYQRLEAGRTVVLMDAGRPPPTPVSHKAHAGCLSIEISTAKDRIFTNCGTSATLKEEWRQAARATAAHTTVVVADLSSCRFVTGGTLARLFGTPIVAGPRDVVAGRHDSDEALVVEARHDGYRRLGIIHHRRISVARNGHEIEGQDRLTRSSALFSRTRAFSIRFHLHPSVQVSVAQDSRSALLTLGSGELWNFSVFGATLRVEESVFLADPKGARGASQLVFYGPWGQVPRGRGGARRGTGEHAPRVRRVRAGEREEQVLPQTVDPARTAGRPAAPEAPEPTEESTAEAGDGDAGPESAKEDSGPELSGPADTPHADAPSPRPDTRREPSLDRPAGGVSGSGSRPAEPRPPASAPQRGATGPGAPDRQPSERREPDRQPPASPSAPPSPGERVEPKFGDPSPPKTDGTERAPDGPDGDDGPDQGGLGRR